MAGAKGPRDVSETLQTDRISGSKKCLEEGGGNGSQVGIYFHFLSDGNTCRLKYPHYISLG